MYVNVVEHGLFGAEVGSRGNTRLTRACRKPYMKSVI